jgi:hypothetical protein
MQGPGGLLARDPDVEDAPRKARRQRRDQEVGAAGRPGQDVARGVQKLAAKTAQFDVLSKAFGGARSAAAIELLLNNFDVLEAEGRADHRTTGRFNEKVKEAQKLDTTKLKESWSEIEANLIKAGAEITPFMVKGSQAVATLTGAFVGLAGRCCCSPRRRSPRSA